MLSASELREVEGVIAIELEGMTEDIVDALVDPNHSLGFRRATELLGLVSEVGIKGVAIILDTIITPGSVLIEGLSDQLIQGGRNWALNVVGKAVSDLWHKLDDELHPTPERKKHRAVRKEGRARRNQRQGDNARSARLARDAQAHAVKARALEAAQARAAEAARRR